MLYLSLVGDKDVIQPKSVTQPTLGC